MKMMNLFLENARLLREKMGIVPLLYGSLGLALLTDEALNPDDIDILIPKVFLTDRWNEFKRMLERTGYFLTDEREHTFVKDGVSYAYADIEDLKPFAGICISDIAVHSEKGTSFLLLSLEQYLQVYEASSQDGYRVNVREKKDREKIALIKSCMKN